MREAPAKRAPERERLNRYLARCGLCSRREADRWMEAGRVTVDGERARPGRVVEPGEVVRIDGEPVAPARERTYLLYHKPRGLLCSRRDDRGRPLIFDRLDVGPAVQSAGRLDMESEGALLLTDDGDLARALTHPKNRVPRRYRVRVAGHPELETIERLRRGGIDMGRGDFSEPWEDLVVDAETKGHTWLTITLRRGRWREVRRTLEATGHPVRRLIRTHFAGLNVEDLAPGSTRPLKAREVRRLRDLAGGDTSRRKGRRGR